MGTQSVLKGASWQASTDRGFSEMEASVRKETPVPTWNFRVQTRETQGGWYRFSEAVMRWPLPVIAGVLIILCLLGYPFLHVTFSVPDARVLPAEQTTRVVSDHLSKDFAQQGNAQLVIWISLLVSFHTS